MKDEASKQPTDIIIDERLYSFKEVKRFIPLSDTTFWRLEKQGLIEFVKIGKLKFMSGAALRKLVTEGAA